MGEININGKICMVTGPNSGIGKATALVLAKMGITVVMVCRDKKKGETSSDEIGDESGNNTIDLYIADLSSQNSIHKLARSYTQRYKKLHVLIDDAGIYFAKHHIISRYPFYVTTGKYFARKRIIQASPESYNTSVAKRLWEVSKEITTLNSHGNKIKPIME